MWKWLQISVLPNLTRDRGQAVDSARDHQNQHHGSENHGASFRVRRVEDDGEVWLSNGGFQDGVEVAQTEYTRDWHLY